jgi:hypothetical protein
MFMVPMTEAQYRVAQKLRANGWKRTGQEAQCKGVQGNAIVFSQFSAVLVLYPDGTFDRNTAQASTKFNWRVGYVDHAAAAKAKAQQEHAAHALVALTKALQQTGS